MGCGARIATVGRVTNHRTRARRTSITVILITALTLLVGCGPQSTTSSATPTSPGVTAASDIGDVSTTTAPTTTLLVPTTTSTIAPPLVVEAAPDSSTEPSTGPASIGIDGPPTPESLILIDIPSTIPEWTIIWSDTSPGATAMTYRDSRTIIMSNGDLGPDPFRRARVLGHEIGHAIDFSRLDEDQRNQWMIMRALTGAWYGCWGCADFGTPAGDWAEAVGHTITGGLDPWRSRLGPPPDATAQAFIWSMLVN